jgi:poly-beta-1,6-N-acetyl-D-glucosamine synthase
MIDGGIWQQLIFWGVWLVIPFIWEIFGGFAAAGIIAVKALSRQDAELTYYPEVTILIPLCNYQASLEACLRSIAGQDYPVGRMEVFLIDNGTTDGSFDVFEKFQAEHSEMRLWWYNSGQGKSKALNKGIFAGTGKYLVNIDSDGWLDKQAVRNIVTRFEADGRVSSMTGVVLTSPEKIEDTHNPLLKIMKICELLEYNESFLVGRSFQSVFNSLHTMAGAFSCFRREVLMKTQMYNPETVGEDAHMTRQVKDFTGGRVTLCENAFFFTDPVDNLDKLYVQRQRWQRGELEVAGLFARKHLGGIWSFMTKPAMRKLISDHTLAFPRLIWLFAMIYLYFINYPLSLLVGANILLYLAYVLNSFLYLGVSSLYLHRQPEMRRYILHRWYMCFLLPLYRFIIYWMRIAGIINSLAGESRWHAKNFSDEVNVVRQGVRHQINSKLRILEKLRNFMNQ